MKRYKCIISYDGSGFSGYQVQPNKRTVQSEFEAVLSKMHKGEHIKVAASGRTDAGVHAKGQVIHFDSSLPISEEKWANALNSLLPEDLSVLSVLKVNSSFHARFDAIGKEYHYVLQLSKIRNPFMRYFACHFPYELNIDAMKEASRFFIGTHDFTSFCSAKTEVVDRVRTIEKIDFIIDKNSLTLKFFGNGFLYNMVRILTGTLLEVGIGKRTPEEMLHILEKKDRRFAGKTAPAQGLYLMKVFYE